MAKLLCLTAYIFYKPSHSDDSFLLLALQWSWPCPETGLKTETSTWLIYCPCDLLSLQRHKSKEIGNIS